MFSLTSSHQYYLYYQPTDMRKSFDALCGIVQNQLHQNPTSGQVFIFINHMRNKIKLLHWEPFGFTIYYKRLEKGTLELPLIDKTSRSVSINWADLVMIIEGISMKNIQKRKRYNM
jgi:transposase